MAYTMKYVTFTFEESSIRMQLTDYGGMRGGKPYRYSVFVHVRSEGAADVIMKGMKGIYKQILPYDPDEGDGWRIIQARRSGFSALMTNPTASFHITIDYKGKRPAVVSVTNSGESLISVPLTDIEEQSFNIVRQGPKYSVTHS
jgi:hypothetical protein